jgi:hypothetical protein
LTSPAGDEQVLSTAEADLLRAFVSSPNRILQREQLMGSRDLSPTDRSIDVRISACAASLNRMPTVRLSSKPSMVPATCFLLLAPSGFTNYSSSSCSWNLLAICCCTFGGTAEYRENSMV